MKTTLVLLLTILCFTAQAQYGVSSGSVSMMRSNGFNSHKENGFLNERMVIVEDFMNFHKHDITIPTQQDVALTIDYDNTLLESDDEFVLQVGVATKQFENRPSHSNKVNVSLVIDKSGSMNGRKLELVKSAIHTFIEGLNPEDYFSLVVFDSSAKVSIAARQIGKDKEELKRIVSNLYAGGSTNLNEGMLLGYKEAVKNHDTNMNSKVILLTDGMTNQGETNHEKIITNSLEFNKKGVDISTIGVGNSIDFDLLRQLSEAGYGSNHFIGDNEEDIQKVFVNELESLIYQIGKSPILSIELPKEMEIVEFYGYNPEFESKHKVFVDFENLNSGSTQIFLMKVKNKGRLKGGSIQTRLTYSINDGLQQIKHDENYSIKRNGTKKEVSKNYHLAFTAQNLKEAATQYAKGNKLIAKQLVQESLAYINAHANKQDKDIARIYGILDRYSPSNCNCYYASRRP